MSFLKPNKITGIEQFIGDAPAFFIYFGGALAAAVGGIKMVEESTKGELALEDLLSLGSSEFTFAAGLLATILGLVVMRRYDYYNDVHLRKNPLKEEGN